ncbi:hypothetical protein [Acidocella aminolytica]|jgi:hypothetical protein|uniref:Uncharacterized protein n=1 Tax=Acidocella aminolytica 101 = DSM 11237 TaxID=1120923 RepID=A0A0D6PFP4_9PROT|nr:hypothetical protein [Acidocella aminolytica]GAN79654.1 hypothetical protein Aam_025_042 [Acidocella aminolytica 101 = DSM 11237]SHF05417.1 hypothetical protein SAMN02746095_01970 [Acidocella aminolytica 101 = DSM 11237]
MRANHVLKPLDYSLAALILFGLCNTFQLVFHGLTVDFDVSSIPLFWRDIHHDGWGFLTTVRSPPDNFQFSLAPHYFFLFWIFDVKPTIVILSGWAIFISGAMGFLGFPIPHGISTVYGLFAALSIIFLLRGGHAAWSFLADLLLIAACVSDPRADSAFLVPLLSASFLMMLLASGKYLPLLRLSMSALFIFAYLKTHGFGLLTNQVPPPVSLNCWPPSKPTAPFCHMRLLLISASLASYRTSV